MDPWKKRVLWAIHTSQAACRFKSWFESCSLTVINELEEWSSKWPQQGPGCGKTFGACTRRWASIRTCKSSHEVGTNFVELPWVILKAYAVLQELCCKRGTYKMCLLWSLNSKECVKSRGPEESQRKESAEEMLLLCQAGAVCTDCHSALVFASKSPFAYYKHC